MAPTAGDITDAGAGRTVREALTREA